MAVFEGKDEQIDIWETSPSRNAKNFKTNLNKLNGPKEVIALLSSLLSSSVRTYVLSTRCSFSGKLRWKS